MVIQTISRRFGAQPALIAKTLDALTRWSSRQHPGLGVPLAVGSFGGRQAAVFDEPVGETFADRIARLGALEPLQALEVVARVAAALAEPHDHGFFCGDVRSSVIRLDGEQVVLGELGLAHIAGSSRFGLPFGHAAYLAPEVLQARVSEPSAAADVYALGVLLYELLCGHRPFRGSVSEVLCQHLESPLPAPPPGVSFCLATGGLLMRLMCKAPHQRLLHARAVASCVNAIIRQKSPCLRAQPARVVSGREWGQIASLDEHRGRSSEWTVQGVLEAPPVGPPKLGEIASPEGVGLDRHLPLPLPEVPSQPASRIQHTSEVLGWGPIGRTFAGTFDGQPAALKILSRELCEHADLVDRLKVRVRRSACVDHPRVVRPLWVGEYEGRTILAFERARGGSLAERLRDGGALPLEEAAERLYELALALEAAATKGFAHGDLRPSKVLLDAQGQALLADLGVWEAACLGAGFGVHGLTFGHPAYLAPEVLQEGAKEPNVRADMYSLGILFFAMLTGHPPFQEDTPRQTLLRHLTSPIPTPCEGLPAPLAELLLKLTAKNPLRRPGSPDELLDLLERCGRQLTQAALLDGTSGVEGVQEFDPTATQITGDQWQALVAKAPRALKDWSRERITETQSQVVGTDFDGLQTLDPTAWRAAVTPPRGAVDKRGLLLSGAGLLAVVCAVTSGLASRPAPSHIAHDIPTQSPPLASASAEHFGSTARARQELTDYEATLRTELESGRSLEALLALDADLDPRVRESAEGRRRVAAAERQARAVVAQEVEVKRPMIEAALAVGEVREAERTLAQLRGRAEGERGFQGLRLQARWRRWEEDASLTRLPFVDPRLVRRAESVLAGRLMSWRSGARLLPGGGVSLHVTGSEALSSDLRSAWAHPGARAAIPPGEGRRVTASGEAPLLLLLSLPLERLVQISLRFELAAAASPSAQVALVLWSSGAGARASAERGWGRSWGLAPAELSADRTLQAAFTGRPPAASPGRPLRLRLTLRPTGSPGRIEVRSSLLSAGVLREGPRQVVARARTRGRVGIYLRNVDGRILSLDVRGLLDAEGVQRMGGT